MDINAAVVGSLCRNASAVSWQSDEPLVSVRLSQLSSKTTSL